ncbi:hypothetical protein J437_LFUL010153 [Ladona fulva]|uniref:aralkylamine N-acetyltransferase n=1 Tax=Ladona fulva TaxID=123851 RepID=A0A8K0K8X1_LADFU|nr:hypothetical protein J437_LFUL010153 [Ladona fulva]
MAQYEIVPIQEKDHGRVLAFLRRTFFADEPLNVALGLLEGRTPCPEDGRPSCPALEAHCRETLSHGLSLMALSGGEIVAVTLNGESTPEGSEQLIEEAKHCTDHKFRKVLNLMVYLDEKTNVFQRFGVDRALEMRILAVDGTWRGRGLATALVRRTLDQCRELGFPLFRVDCSSAFSAKAMERLGLDCIHTTKYEEYLEEEDEDIIGAPQTKRRRPVFQPSEPHRAVSAYVKVIATE